MRIRATGSAMKRGGGGAGGSRVDCATGLIRVGRERGGEETGSRQGDGRRPAGSCVPASEDCGVLAGATGANLDSTEQMKYTKYCVVCDCCTFFTRFVL